MFISAKTCDGQLREKADIVQLSIATSKYAKLSDIVRQRVGRLLAAPNAARWNSVYYAVVN